MWCELAVRNEIFWDEKLRTDAIVVWGEGGRPERRKINRHIQALILL